MPSPSRDTESEIRNRSERDKTNFIKTAGLAGILAVGFATFPRSAMAAQSVDPVREGQAVVTELSADASATTYWVSEADGWRVVTTVDTVIGQNTETEKHAVVRFSSILQPGRSQLTSVPFAIGQQQQTLSVRRLGDRIEVARVAGPASP